VALLSLVDTEGAAGRFFFPLLSVPYAAEGKGEIACRPFLS